MLTKRFIKADQLIALVCVVLGASFLLFPGLFFVPQVGQAAGLSIIVIGLLVTGVVPEYLTIILFFVLAMLFAVDGPDVIFSGFSSKAFWLLFGGSVIGIAVMSTGLGRRIAAMVAKRLEGSYLRIVSGMVFVGVLFAFLMPSATGRLVLLLPITLAVADHFGFKKGSNGRVGLVTATVMSTIVAAYGILPANVPNMILAGLAENQYQFHILYGEFMVLHFPTMSFLKALVIIAVTLWLFPDTPQTIDDSELHQKSAISGQEKWLGIILLVLLALWMTDFVHHISPAWVALAGALVLMMPKIGLVTVQQVNKDINHTGNYIVAGILGLGAMMSSTGLGSEMAGPLIGLLPLEQGSDFFNFMNISVASAASGLVATAPGIPAIMMPLADQLAQESGFSIEAVIMMQVLGYSTLMFPYQAAPLLIGLQMSGENITRCTKAVLYIALLNVVLVYPASYLWWQVVDWL